MVSSGYARDVTRWYDTQPRKMHRMSVETIADGIRWRRLRRISSLQRRGDDLCTQDGPGQVSHDPAIVDEYRSGSGEECGDTEGKSVPP